MQCLQFAIKLFFINCGFIDHVIFAICVIPIVPGIVIALFELNFLVLPLFIKLILLIGLLLG